MKVSIEPHNLINSENNLYYKMSHTKSLIEMIYFKITRR
jgi:hypothetical protein